MSSPSYREPNDDEQLARMTDEREEYERSLVKRIAVFDPELAREVSEIFALE